MNRSLSVTIFEYKNYLSLRFQRWANSHFTQGNAATRRIYREPNWITAISDRGYNNVSLL